MSISGGLPTHEFDELPALHAIGLVGMHYFSANAYRVVLDEFIATVHTEVPQNVSLADLESTPDLVGCQVNGTTSELVLP